MADNLNIKGIRSPDDEMSEGVREDGPPTRRGRKSHGRKPFAIESRLVLPKNEHPNSVFHTLNLDKVWWAHGRYETAARRDQAYAALVKKEEAAGPPTRWVHWEYRKLG